MTQTFDLNKMGLAPMGELEMQTVEGGNVFWDYVVGKAIDYAVDLVVTAYKNVNQNIGVGGSAGVPGGGGGFAF